MATDLPQSAFRSRLPNALTWLRIVLALPVALLIVAGAVLPAAALAAFLLFVFAASLDWFDGFLARRWNVISEMGRALDPVADKILVAAALLGLMAAGAPAWVLLPAVVIVGRDFLVCGAREFAAGARRTLHVTRLAKWKTAAELAALSLLLAAPALAPFWMEGAPFVFRAGAILLWIAAALSAWTGSVYLRAVLRP